MKKRTEKNTGRDYGYLLDHFGEEKIRDRVAFLIKTAELLIQSRKAENDVLINNALIEQVTIDYFADIKRLKDFHCIEKVEATKIAAYTAHWIRRRKPLQLRVGLSEGSFEEKPFLLDINEWFASYLFKSMILDMREPVVTDAESLRRWNNFNLLLIYFLVYRVVTPHALELATLAMIINPPYGLLMGGGE